MLGGKARSKYLTPYFPPNQPSGLCFLGWFCFSFGKFGVFLVLRFSWVSLGQANCRGFNRMALMLGMESHRQWHIPFEADHRGETSNHVFMHSFHHTKPLQLEAYRWEEKWIHRDAKPNQWTNLVLTSHVKMITSWWLHDPRSRPLANAINAGHAVAESPGELTHNDRVIRSLLEDNQSTAYEIQPGGVSSRLYVDVLGGYVTCSKCPSTLWKDRF